ncbi:decaprenyl-phosphate phosphoribosyltransferase [Sungkyunkwania multivorans]|uniref:Decaprenyl-phosphate phosphoribosyltransferase n=1 Tax=Sungkyunkwania multivorans TaxID=1173618 RepID=A0ABW3CX27_9FLAO
MKTIHSYIHLFRVHQYVKNLFVFAPLFFVFDLSPDTIGKAMLAFLLFSLIASAVYIINDISDVYTDRAHPIKRFRPIASGAIAVPHALRITLFLLISGMIIAFLFDRDVFFVLSSYLVLNVLYTFWLKHVPVFDVLIIGLGFVLRILAGSYATDIAASNWILAMTFLLAIFLVFSKRRADLVLMQQEGQNSKKNLRLYSIKFLDSIMVFLGVVICVSYLFYTRDRLVIERYGNIWVLLTTPWVVFGVFRYLFFSRSHSEYIDPTSIILKDSWLQGIITGWIITFVVIRFI